MTHEICISGFGGQGVLSLGQVIAYSSMLEGKEVCWMPSYGPEMRGGTANCTVIVSEKKISSPIVSFYDVCFCLNQPSVDKFESHLKKDGILIYETSTVINPPKRKDVKIFPINGLEIAVEIGARQIHNMILLGGLLSIIEIVKDESVKNSLEKILPPHKKNLIELNMLGLNKGKEIAKLLWSEK